MNQQLPNIIANEINIAKFVYNQCNQCSPYFKFHAIYRLNNQIITTEVSMLVLLDNQKVTLTVTPVSVKGNIAPLDGVPVWSVSDETLLSVVPGEDGLSAVVTAIGPLGTAQVVVKGDADLGEGIVEITGTLDVEILASGAVSFTVIPGIPEPA